MLALENSPGMPASPGGLARHRCSGSDWAPPVCAAVVAVVAGEQRVSDERRERWACPRQLSVKWHRNATGYDDDLLLCTQCCPLNSKMCTHGHDDGRGLCGGTVCVLGPIFHHGVAELPQLQLQFAIHCLCAPAICVLSSGSTGCPPSHPCCYGQ